MRIRALLAAGAVAIVGCASLAWAAGDSVEPKEVDWTFQGPFGAFDRAQVQRGFKVYASVCASCHGLRHVYFRHLLQVGIKPEEMKDLMAQRKISVVDDAGDTVQRNAVLGDRITSPFPNDQAAAKANNGKVPPDLSLMVKAREGGANYLYSLLTGYVSAAECAKRYKDTQGQPLKPAEGQHCNAYFPGHIIAMAPPITADGQVDYEGKDAPKPTRDQMARDVTAFLAWTAEPELEDRKRMGFRTLLFLLIMTGLFFLIYKRVWRDVKKK